MADKLLSVLQQDIRKEMNEMADHLATGGAEDFNAYNKVVGVIEGLARAERMMLDLVERQERAEEGG